MLIECEVWKQDGSLIDCGGMSYNRMYTQRTIIDTDLFNWWDEVRFIKSGYGYPYHNQCLVPYKERGKYPLIVSKDVLSKIRNAISGGSILKI